MVSRVPVSMHMLVMLCCLSEVVVSHISAREAEDRAQVQAQAHDQDQARATTFSDNSNGWFQLGEGLAPSPMGLIPLGSTYSRVGLQFLRRLRSPPASGKQRMEEFYKPPIIVDTGSALRSVDDNRAFQVLAAGSTDSNAAESEDRSDQSDARLKLEVVIGLAIAIPIFLAALLFAWLWFKFCYRPRNEALTGMVPRARRSAPEADAAFANSSTNKSKVQLLGSWLSTCSSTSFTFSTRPKRQVVWQSSACEMQYAKLAAATNNFSPANVLGEGGTSRVYRAKLDDDTFAAVKRLESTRDRRRTGLQFQSEVELMRQVRHPNLVSLLGYCKHGDQRLLVYELMQNGSLEDQLYGPSKGSALTWNLRVKIALESARGLEYLHEHCVPPVVHRDLKVSNILLDGKFNAKISDFGLATPLEGLTREESLQLIGTIGYVAPEFFETGALTEKSDVYAFGVVLLELLTGRKPVDHSLPLEEQSIVNWAKPQLSDRRKLPQLVAPTLKSHLNLKHLYQVAAVAALCVCEEPSYRPLIADVVQSLVPLVPMELGGALRPAHAHNPSIQKSPTASADLTPRRIKSRSRSFKSSDNISITSV